MPKLILLLFVVAIAFVVPHFMRVTAVPSVGATAPDFTLASQDGRPVTLSQYRGKWVALYFYPEDAAGGSPVELQSFERDLPKYAAANAVVIGVSVQKVNQQLATENTGAFQLLLDPEKKVTTEYGSVDNYSIGTTAARSNFLINPQGKIVDEFVGVDPGKHSQEVLAKLTRQESK